MKSLVIKTLGQRLGYVQLLYQQINNWVMKTLFSEQATYIIKTTKNSIQTCALSSSLVKFHKIEN